MPPRATCKVDHHGLTPHRRANAARAVAAAVALAASALGISSPAAAQTQPSQTPHKTPTTARPWARWPAVASSTAPSARRACCAPTSPLTARRWPYGQCEYSTARTRPRSQTAGSPTWPPTASTAPSSSGCSNWASPTDAATARPSALTTPSPAPIWRCSSPARSTSTPAPTPASATWPPTPGTTTMSPRSRRRASPQDAATAQPSAHNRQTTRAQMATFLARATGLVPLPTPTPAAATYKAVTVGGGHTCALRTDNTITCWDTGRSTRPRAPTKPSPPASRTLAP